ncbi:MAG: undecaprenyl-diphosphate phosphatase [Planctomycetes bacterium]|nr:undecaprenyl-diphosphate phosphatase [Planctomycetota bacterium]
MQLELWKIVILAVVQGVTEFLPVSSSGHLVILAALLSGGDPEQLDVADVNIVLHLGTLGSVLIFYRGRLRELLAGDWRTTGMVLLASLPAACVGIPIVMFAKEWLSSPLLAGCMLTVTATVLALASRTRPGDQDYRQITWGKSLLIGVAQACAVLPGLSRSGTTISTGIYLGLRPQAAATFSFMMAIVAIGGAGLIEGISLFRHGFHTPWQNLLYGALISFAVGLGALSVLMRLLEKGRFLIFAAWCLCSGLTIVFWQLR